MFEIWSKITTISVVFFGLMIQNISADSSSQNDIDSILTLQDQTLNSYKINIAVFVDYTTVDYYKKNLTKHVMSQINKTSEIFQHSSEENSIHIILKELIIVTEDFTKNNTSSNNEYIENFCEWKSQLKLLTDCEIGILLTRTNIYNDNSNGYAVKGSMCNSTNKCAVVVDDGDDTSTRITYSINDILNMDDKSKENFDQEIYSYSRNIINTFITNKEYCSNLFVSLYELGGLEEWFEISQALVFDRNELCQTVFNFDYLNQSSNDQCNFDIICKEKLESIPMKSIKVVQNGNKCDIESYCYHGECKDNWNPWIILEECNKPCGGGIQRLALNTSILNSQFEINSRYETCNNHECPDTPENFESITRDEQCARVNVENRNMTSYFSEDYPCRLYCLIDAELDFFGSVIDGTSCSNNNFHVCVNEECKNLLVTDYYNDSTVSTENQTRNYYQIDIAVFVDYTTVDYYKKNLTKHVMSQINKTSEIFQHSSEENSIHIILKDLIIVTEDFTNNNTSSNNEYIENFCEWKSQLNLLSNCDIGILLTRTNIYNDDSNGYAVKGSMCNSTNKCAVVVDDGDDTSTRITYSINDILNINEKFERVLNQEMSNYYRNIINTFVVNEKYCSKQLKDLEESIDWIEISHALLFDENELCQTIFGLNFSDLSLNYQCTFDINCKGPIESMPVKIILAIQNDNKCDIGSYCYYGQCKDNWNPWIKVGECDKTCGGGIQKLALNTSILNYQFKSNLRYETCNNHGCPETSGSFKPITLDEQCSRVNSKMKYYPEKQPCRLYCTIDSELEYLNDYYGSVINGTPCSNDSNHFCINENCEHSLLTEYYDGYNFTVNLDDPSITSPLKTSIFTDFYSIPYYVRIIAVVDSSMVNKYQDNLTIHIQMLISEASNVIKHSTLGLSLNIVLIDIRIIKTDFISSNTIGAVDSNSILYVFGEWARNHLDNYDIAILFTTTSFGQDSGASSMRYTFPNWIVVEDSGVFTISTIAHEIGHALGVNHEFDDDICNKKISINKVHFLMSYNTKPPFIWSNCSRTGITYFLNQQLTFFKKPEKFIDLSKVPLMGQFYSADKHCEIKFGTGFTLNRTSNYPIEECRELICSDGISVEKSLNGMFDFTPCGIEKICYNNDCIKQTQLKRINGGWSEWIPTGSCSGSCDIGIRKSIRKCNNPQPEYGGNYCFGKKLRFETCNLKPCSETTIDFRQQQCSKFNNNSTNFTAFYDPQDNEQLCKLTCQEISEKNSSIILENIMDGTFCGSNSHKFDYMCNNGECKKIGCTENDNVFDPNSILDICNVSRGYNSNKEVLIQDSRSQILSQLLYEPPENWTLDNCCIIIYRMKKNWQMIIDYWNEEKLNLLGISELLYNNSIISWDEFYKINHHDVTWSHLKGLQNKTTENCPKIKEIIRNFSNIYWKNLMKCRLNYHGKSGARMKIKINSKKINITYFKKINELEKSCHSSIDPVDAQRIIDEKSLMINNTIKLVEKVHRFKNELSRNLNLIESCVKEQEKKFKESIRIFENSCFPVKEYLHDKYTFLSLA